MQRTDLNPLEEAGGYQALASEYGHSHEDIAKIVGKSRSHVTNTLRLLKLPEPVKAYIHAGKIIAGAARMLVGAPDPEEMAREIVDRGLNVRQVEALAKDRAKGPATKKRAVKNADTLALERRVSTRSASPSRSITAARAAYCRSTIAASISSTTCCGDWSARGRAQWRSVLRRFATQSAAGRSVVGWVERQRNPSTFRGLTARD